MLDSGPPGSGLETPDLCLDHRSESELGFEKNGFPQLFVQNLDFYEIYTHSSVNKTCLKLEFLSFFFFFLKHSLCNLLQILIFLFFWGDMFSVFENVCLFQGLPGPSGLKGDSGENGPPVRTLPFIFPLYIQ